MKAGGMKGETMKGSSAVGLISKAVADIPKPTPSPPQHSAKSSVGKHKGASSSYTSNQGFNRTQRKLLLERELVENEAKRQALALKREQKLEAKRERQMKIRDGDTVKYDIKESGVGSQADGSQNDTKPRSRMGGNGDGNASNASIDSASSGWLASSGASVSSTQTACIENSEQTMAELLREAAGHPEPGIIPVGGEDAAAELLAAHGLGRNPAKKQHRSSKPEHSAPPSAHWSTASTSGSTASHKQDATRIYREMLKHRHNELENSSRFVDPEKAMWDRLAKNDKFKALMKSDSKELTEEEELKLCIKMRFGIDVEIEDE